MRKIFIKKNYGFTLLELVVAISILGIMIGGSIVRYSKVTRTAQREQNRANIVIIREAFFQYFYRNHMDGNPQGKHMGRDHQSPEGQKEEKKK